MKSDDFKGKRVELNVWGLQRFYDLYEHGEAREPITIRLENYGLKSIPCIKAEMTDNLDYDAYLAIVPGQFLNDIYYEYGSRLLEGNVRAFLSNRGKINKGIRETIRKAPTKFFAYNNGIACTAKKVVLSDDGHQIVEMDDLQIINGGQTTASLNSAVLKDKLSLANIFVPMKLTVIKDEDYDTMIQNISKYANSQNKVTDSDLFSNHPFHRTFEALSKKIPAPAKDGELNGSFWYYERSRGKYEQEQFKLLKKSERDAFQKKYPKSQVIKKEELAKYYVACALQRPDIVNKGSTKNMNYFAAYIDKMYEDSPEKFNEEFYKLCIDYAIIYKQTDILVAKAPWYHVGGYKLNIVPYTVSKLFTLIPQDYTLDFDRIWKKQELYPSLRNQLDNLAQFTNSFVTDSNGIIVTEYCKKEDTWNKFKAQNYNLSEEFVKDLVPKSLLQEKMSASKKDQKLSASLNIEYEIVNLGGEYWRNLIQEGIKRRILSASEIDLLNIAASIDTPRPRIASPRQAKLIWKIREKLDKAGVLV
ncbi:MAG TPA: AIPR family protein [Candidatus Enterosoma merdigallinarum]|nr:AIPR family protein [Candidatus Enterosoma merdigallinarum]